jgi:hypothetical protein
LLFLQLNSVSTSPPDSYISQILDSAKRKIKEFPVRAVDGFRHCRKRIKEGKRSSDQTNNTNDNTEERITGYGKNVK